MKRPLVTLTVLFSLGIFFGTKIAISFLLLYCLAAIFLVLGIFAQRYSWIFNVCISFLMFLLGLILLKNSQNLPNCHISKYTCLVTRESCTVKGFIADEPQGDNKFRSFKFKTEEIQFDGLNRNCCGEIMVYLRGGKDLSYGQELILSGNIEQLLHFNQRYKEYLHQQGIWRMMRLKSEADIVRLNKNKGLKVRKLTLGMKAKIEGIIFRYVSGGAAGILNAMILGDKKNIPKFILDSMVKSGTIHILVVSGFNVGIVAFVIILILKLLRIPRTVRIMLAMPILIIYCLATGASSPVVRATVMAGVFIFSYLFKRQPDIYNSLSLAAMFILGLNPQELFDIGFQLSFSSVIAIVWIYPKMQNLLGLKHLKTKFLRFVVEGFLVSFSAWLGTMGFVAHYFRIFSPVTVLANLVIVPLASLITLCGFSLGMAGLAFPAVAPAIGYCSEFLVLVLIKLNSLFLRLPGAYLYL